MANDRETMINHRGRRMTLNDFMKLGSLDHIKKDANGELYTQDFFEYMHNMCAGISAILNPEMYCRRLLTDAEFRAKETVWYEKQKKIYEEEENMAKVEELEEEDMENVKVLKAAEKRKVFAQKGNEEIPDPAVLKAAEKRKELNRRTRENKKQKKILLKSEKETIQPDDEE